jgi:hypothetical protein
VAQYRWREGSHVPSSPSDILLCTGSRWELHLDGTKYFFAPHLAYDKRRRAFAKTGSGQTDRHENNQTRCKGLGGVCAGADVRSRCGGALVWRLQGFHSGANGLLCIVLYSSPVQYVAAHTTRVIEGTKNELSIPCKMHSTHSMRTVHAHSILSSTCNG